MIELPTCVFCNECTNEGGLNLIQISIHDIRGRSLRFRLLPTTYPDLKLILSCLKNPALSMSKMPFPIT